MVADGVSELVAGLDQSYGGGIIRSSIERRINEGKISPHEDSLFDPRVVDIIFYPIRGIMDEIDDIYHELNKRALACEAALIDREARRLYLSPDDEVNFFILVKAYFSEKYEEDHSERYKITFDREILLQDASVKVNMAYQRFVNYYENSNNR